MLVTAASNELRPPASVSSVTSRRLQNGTVGSRQYEQRPGFSCSGAVFYGVGRVRSQFIRDAGKVAPRRMCLTRYTPTPCSSAPDTACLFLPASTTRSCLRPAQPAPSVTLSPPLPLTVSVTAAPSHPAMRPHAPRGRGEAVEAAFSETYALSRQRVCYVRDPARPREARRAKSASPRACRHADVVERRYVSGADLGEARGGVL